MELDVDDADRRGSVMRFLRADVWPLVPPAERGRRLTCAEEDALLGFDERGA